MHKTRLMPLFDAYSRIALDPCALATRDDMNLQYATYNLASTRNPGGACASHVLDMHTQNTHLLITPGYGLDPCFIDVDSRMHTSRDQLTHGRSRQPLASRVFTAAPDFGRGGLVSDVESSLLSGHDTSVLRECGHVTEVDWNRFDPGVCPSSVENVVNPWPIGEPSREIARSAAFIRDLGCDRKLAVPSFAMTATD